MTPEGKIKEMCKKLLKQVGAFHFMPVSNGLGRHGIPDLICCHNGRFFSIETKSPGKKPTALQNKCMDEISNSGGKCFVVDGEESLMQVKLWMGV